MKIKLECGCGSRLVLETSEIDNNWVAKSDEREKVLKMAEDWTLAHKDHGKKSHETVTNCNQLNPVGWMVENAEGTCVGLHHNLIDAEENRAGWEVNVFSKKPHRVVSLLRGDTLHDH